MVSQAKGGCKECGSLMHTKMYHNPKKPIKRSAIKPKLDCLPSEVKTRKKKLTTPQVKAKAKTGANLTIADKKILYDYQSKKAWTSFATYIRHRDCLATTGTFESGMCVTCVVRGDYTQFPYSRIQAGHGVGGRKAAVLFHEEIVNGQCDHDNRQGSGGLAGDYGNYMTHFVKKYGLEHAEELQALKHAYRSKYTYLELIDKEKEYKDKLEHLKTKDNRTKLL
jgi:hypothetical protein